MTCPIFSEAGKESGILSGADFCDLIVGMEHAGTNSRPVVGAIIAVSGLAISFLLWLLYIHHASADFAGRWMFLPALNALLNGLCAITLCVGLYFIKHHNIGAHRTSMLVAFAFSSAFLVSYIVNHALHGDTIFPGHGTVRTLYLSILASHVVLSIVALPMVLTTFFFLSDRPVFCDAPPHRALDVPGYLALRFDYWRGWFSPSSRRMPTRPGIDPPCSRPRISPKQ